MALIKSTILAQISGSINGTTFSHNKGGAYARNRSLPANPGTDRQDQVRTALSSLSKMWATALSQEQRDIWNAYGAGVTVINRIGDPIHLSGIAAFLRVNLFRMASLGAAPTLNAPDGTGDSTPIPAFVSAVMDNSTPPAVLTISTTSDLTGYGLIYYYSPPVSPGIRYYRGPYAGFSGESDILGNESSFNMPASYIADQYVGFKIILYRESDSLKMWEIFLDPIMIPSP